MVVHWVAYWVESKAALKVVHWAVDSAVEKGI
jgi:hypothetical protein